MKIFLLLTIFLISSNVFAASIKEVGKIEFDKKSNTYVFYFLKDNKVQSVIIRPTNKSQSEELKSFSGKAIVLEGEIRTFVKNKEGFEYREEVNNSKVRALNSELLKIDTKKIIAQYDLLSHEKKVTKLKMDQPTMQISDQSANSIIALAGTLVGIATGPIALVPVAAYLVEEGMSKK
jgi:hypothetical protein